MKFTISLLLIFINIQLSIGQNKLTTIEIDGKNYPMTNLYNSVTMINMSNLEWKAQMKTYDFATNGVDKGCVYFNSSTNKNADRILNFKRFPNSEIQIEWSDLSKEPVSIFDILINDLEPYYVNTNEKGVQTYGFKFQGNLYNFDVLRENIIEIVRITKIKLN